MEIQSCSGATMWERFRRNQFEQLGELEYEKSSSMRSRDWYLEYRRNQVFATHDESSGYYQYFLSTDVKQRISFHARSGQKGCSVFTSGDFIYYIHLFSSLHVFHLSFSYKKGMWATQIRFPNHPSSMNLLIFGKLLNCVKSTNSLIFLRNLKVFKQ